MPALKNHYTEIGHRNHFGPDHALFTLADGPRRRRRRFKQRVKIWHADQFASRTIINQSGIEKVIALAAPFVKRFLACVTAEELDLGSRSCCLASDPVSAASNSLRARREQQIP